jgi:hypothetical protein
MQMLQGTPNYPPPPLSSSSTFPDPTPQNARHPLDPAAGRSQLHLLCASGSHAAVQELLTSLKTRDPVSASTEVNLADFHGFTPLHSASCLDVSHVGEGVAATICASLVLAGCNVSERDRKGSTALHWAARAGNGDVVHLLTSQHCPLDAVNKDSETALHWAMRTGVRGLNSVRVLVEDGAKTSIFNKNFKRALDVAAEGFAYYDYPLSPPSTAVGTKEALPSASERDKARTNLLGCEPRLRTLVLHHPECLEHLPRSTADWECPDRIRAILNRIGAGEDFGAHEVTASRASGTWASRPLLPCAKRGPAASSYPARNVGQPPPLSLRETWASRLLLPCAKPGRAAPSYPARNL